MDHLLGNYAAARREYEAIVASAERHPADGEARRLAKRQLGDLSMLQGDLVGALKAFDECAAMAGGDRLWQLECERFTGHVYRFNCMMDDAATRYSRVAELSAASDLRGMYGKAMVNLAETHCWDAPEEALEAGRTAIEINEACGNQIETGKALTAAAIALLNLGRLRESEEHLERAITIQERVSYRAGLVFAAGARACQCVVSGDDAGVRAALEWARRESEDLGVYRFLAWFYRAVCAGEDGIGNGGFKWIDERRLHDGINSTAALLHEGSRRRPDPAPAGIKGEERD